MKKQLIVIAGPTAVGKTALAVELARHFGCPVLSADSRQFYREMSIGTAKPTEAEMQGVPHEFVGHISIHDSYNAGQYERDAIARIETLFAHHQQLILVGGSGLYINAVLNGVDAFEEIPVKLRDELNLRYREQGVGYLQQLLHELDPDYYAQVDLQNPQRLIRALEVCLHTRKPYSSFRSKAKKDRPFDAIPLLINTDREQLYERINRRVDDMMTRGLLAEVNTLLAYRQLNALNTVGYKELFDYLDHTISLEDAVAQIKQNTRRYAKRQLTWFNNQGDYETFGPGDLDKIKAYLDIVMQHA